MKPLGAHLALGLVIGWLVFRLAGPWMPPLFSVEFGIIVGIAVSFGLQRNIVIGGAVALFAPFGVMLPALAMADMVRTLGLDVPGFAGWELAAFLVLYTGFLCTAFGLIPIDLYRLGYAPLPVAAMVLAVCLYGFATGNWFLPLVAVLGQALWVTKLGSSNWFDYVLHVLLWPVAFVALVAKIF